MPQTPMTFEDIEREHPFPWTLSYQESAVIDKQGGTVFTFDRYDWGADEGHALLFGIVGTMNSFQAADIMIRRVRLAIKFLCAGHPDACLAMLEGALDALDITVGVVSKPEADGPCEICNNFRKNQVWRYADDTHEGYYEQRPCPVCTDAVESEGDKPTYVHDHISYDGEIIPRRGPETIGGI